VIEALVAAGVALTAVVSLLALFPTNHSSLSRARVETQITNAARAKIEELRNARFPALAGGADVQDGLLRSWNVTVQGELATISVRVTEPRTGLTRTLTTLATP
jgi:hypothetical protein